MTLEVPVVQALDPGIYPAHVTGLETKTLDDGTTFRIWSFVINDGENTKVSASSSMAFGTKSKTFKWVTSLIGRTPVPGEKLDVIGLPCQLHLIVDEDSGYNRVEAVLPSVNSARRASSPTPSTASASTDDSFADGTPLEEPPMVEEGDLGGC
jgi:hypothetical protein